MKCYGSGRGSIFTKNFPKMIVIVFTVFQLIFLYHLSNSDFHTKVKITSRDSVSTNNCPVHCKKSVF